MSADLYEQTRKADLERAMAEYKSAKENDQRLVRIALNESNPTRREEEMRAIEQENRRLQTVVEGLMTAWSEGKLADDPEAQDKVIDLEQELETFKKRLGSVQNNKDRVFQLQSVLSSLTSESEKEKSVYYGYIIAILILLVVVFVFFVMSYWRSVTASVQEVMTPMPMPPSNQLI